MASFSQGIALLQAAQRIEKMGDADSRLESHPQSIY